MEPCQCGKNFDDCFQESLKEKLELREVLNEKNYKIGMVADEKDFLGHETLCRHGRISLIFLSEKCTAISYCPKTMAVKHVCKGWFKTR